MAKVGKTHCHQRRTFQDTRFTGEVPLDQCAKEALRKLWAALVENPHDHQRYYLAGRFPLRVRIGGQRGENDVYFGLVVRLQLTRQLHRLTRRERRRISHSHQTYARLTAQKLSTKRDRIMRAVKRMKRYAKLQRVSTLGEALRRGAALGDLTWH